MRGEAGSREGKGDTEREGAAAAAVAGDEVLLRGETPALGLVDGEAALAARAATAGETAATAAGETAPVAAAVVAAAEGLNWGDTDAGEAALGTVTLAAAVVVVVV